MTRRRDTGERVLNNKLDLNGEKWKVQMKEKEKIRKDKGGRRLMRKKEEILREAQSAIWCNLKNKKTIKNQ